MASKRVGKKKKKKKSQSRKTPSKRTRRTKSTEAPQGPDEFLKLDNEVAKQKPPRELVESTNRITIYVPSGKLDPSYIQKVRGVRGAIQLELPEGAGIGLPGRKVDRVAAPTIRRGIKRGVDTESFRPGWIDYIPHPKMSTAEKPRLRRIGGQLVEPHYGVFGSDDRAVYYPSGYPWTCIGKVYAYDSWPSSSPSWSGSGVLIGSRVLLTAGHVVPWGASSWAMRFVPAYYDGSSTLGTSVDSWVSDARGYDTGGVSAWDMAVCRLYTPLGSSYGYFGAKTYSSSWEGGNYWTLAGYPGAVAGGNRPSRQMWFPVDDDDSSGSATEVEYRADASNGNSGGPCFGFWSGLPYVIGAHSGGTKTTFLWWTLEDTNVSAGGSAIVDLIRWARSNWS